MIDSEEDRRLQCRYSLRGLPPAHRCPECGWAYDLETVVFRPRRALATVGGYFVALTRDALLARPVGRPRTYRLLYDNVSSVVVTGEPRIRGGLLSSAGIDDSPALRRISLAGLVDNKEEGESFRRMIVEQVGRPIG